MIENLPVLLLKKLVLLPYQEVRIELNVELSKSIVDLSENFYGNKLLVVCPDDVLESNISVNDLPKLGVLSKIKSKIELPNGNYRVIINGLNRVMVNKYLSNKMDEDLLEASVKRLYIDNSSQSEEIAILKTLKSNVEKYMRANPSASNSVLNTISNITDLDMLTDIIANYMPFDLTKKISYMNEFDYLIRANNLIKDINVELEVLSIENKIDDEIRESFEKEQRDFIIKQKINKLNEELGLNVDKTTEVSLYNDLISELDIPDKTKEKLYNEVKKYSYTSESNPDLSVIRNYLDTIINLPWNKYSNDETDIKKIKKSLDKSHYGLDEVKQRILEYIAIKKNNNKINAPIICLVGPPGTGKTTLGMSIAKALNREFYKISVGGLNDSTELTGHKRTYLGSSPGKIIQGIKKCGTANPLMLIDEVDKIVCDYKGDPSAVLLDILDPKQNNCFIDNYLEEPFDLSKIIFILTANDITSIPNALRDRLEIIEISSYTELEKVDIAKKYLIPNIINDYNAPKIKISDEIILSIINGYTKESGVRGLDRVFRKIYRYFIMSDENIKTLTSSLVKKILGPVKYDVLKIKKNTVGSSVALGVTPFGGVVINFEAILKPGTGKLIITGNIEDSIKESASVALTHIEAFAKEYNIDIKKLNNSDIHINALDYRIKKDGTSGGVALTSVMLSLLLNKEIPATTCFTGEISLHGTINKVGGIKEKVIGAYNNGFKDIYIPVDNENDLLSVPKDIKDKLNIKCVSNYESIYEDLFKKHK